jgi:hypothetical protein
MLRHLLWASAKRPGRRTARVHVGLSLPQTKPLSPLLTAQTGVTNHQGLPVRRVNLKRSVAIQEARVFRMRLGLRLSLMAALCTSCLSAPAMSANAPSLAPPITPVAAPPLPVIGGTKTSYICSSLRQVIAPAVYDLMAVDRILVSERVTLADMGKQSRDPQAGDKIEGSAAMNLMRTRLSADIKATARNLMTVEALLKQREADAAATDEDRRTIDGIRDSLRHIAAQQNEALNLVSGYVETELQGQMRTEFDSQLLQAVSPVGGSAKLQAPLTGAGLQMNEPIAVYDRRKLLTAGAGTGRTVYDDLSRTLSLREQAVATMETALTPSIVKIAQRCGGEAR